MRKLSIHNLSSEAQAALRIAAGLAFMSHGAQKLLGWFGGAGPQGGTVELMSPLGIAGIIELVGGALLVVGLLTRPVAFIASGEMAVAYFWMHWARSGQMWWWENRGEVVLLYSFIWLFFAAAGPGALSLDRVLARRPFHGTIRDQSRQPAPSHAGAVARATR